MKYIMKSIIVYDENSMIKYKIEDMEYADTFTKRLIGLMGRKKFRGMIFKQKKRDKISSSIHTSFMKTPIDIIYINDNMEIAEKTRLKPWRIYIPHTGKTRYIIELSPHITEKYDIQLTDKIVIQDETPENQEPDTEGDEHHKRQILQQRI